MRGGVTVAVVEGVDASLRVHAQHAVARQVVAEIAAPEQFLGVVAIEEGLDPVMLIEIHLIDKVKGEDIEPARTLVGEGVDAVERRAREVGAAIVGVPIGVAAKTEILAASAQTENRALKARNRERLGAALAEERYVGEPVTVVGLRPPLDLAARLRGVVELAVGAEVIGDVYVGADGRMGEVALGLVERGVPAERAVRVNRRSRMQTRVRDVLVA